MLLQEGKFPAVSSQQYLVENAWVQTLNNPNANSNPYFKLGDQEKPSLYRLQQGDLVQGVCHYCRLRFHFLPFPLPLNLQE